MKGYSKNYELKNLLMANKCLSIANHDSSWRQSLISCYLKVLFGLNSFCLALHSAHMVSNGSLSPFHTIHNIGVLSER